MAACEGPTGPHLSGAAHLLADSNGDATTRVHGRACRGSYRHWRLGYLPPILRQPCVADMTGRSAGAMRTSENSLKRKFGSVPVQMAGTVMR
jgi:hypothetical protein